MKICGVFVIIPHPSLAIGILEIWLDFSKGLTQLNILIKSHQFELNWKKYRYKSLRIYQMV